MAATDGIAIRIGAFLPEAGEAGVWRLPAGSFVPVDTGDARPGQGRAADPVPVPVIGLPGYPLAAAVIFELFAVPLLAVLPGLQTRMATGSRSGSAATGTPRPAATSGSPSDRAISRQASAFTSIRSPGRASLAGSAISPRHEGHTVPGGQWRLAVAGQEAPVEHRHHRPAELQAGRRGGGGYGGGTDQP